MTLTSGVCTVTIPFALMLPTIQADCYLQAVMHGDSLVKALEEIGVDSSFDSRKKIAAVNGIDNYMGTAAQNMELFVLLRAGRLRKGE